jgi:hypothetical protein
MRAFLAWAGPNVLRFLAVWAVIGTAVFVWVDFGHSVRMPSSILQAISIPLLIVVVLFLAVFTAFVALLLLSSAVAVWLAVYMSALWFIARRLDGLAARAVAITLAGALWLVFLRGNDRLFVYAMLAVGILYGYIVRLPTQTTRRRSRR